MIELCRVYSFLGQSTRILGHNSINIRGRDKELSKSKRDNIDYLSEIDDTKDRISEREIEVGEDD